MFCHVKPVDNMASATEFSSTVPTFGVKTTESSVVYRIVCAPSAPISVKYVNGSVSGSLEKMCSSAPVGKGARPTNAPDAKLTARPA